MCVLHLMCLSNNFKRTVSISTSCYAIHFQSVSALQKEALSPLNSRSPSLSFPAPSNHQPALSCNGFVQFQYFTLMASGNNVAFCVWLLLLSIKCSKITHWVASNIMHCILSYDQVIFPRLRCIWFMNSSVS